MKRLIAFALIDLFHVQLQEPAKRLTTTIAFVCHLSLNFIIFEYFTYLTRGEGSKKLSYPGALHSPPLGKIE